MLEKESLKKENFGIGYYIGRQETIARSMVSIIINTYGRKAGKWDIDGDPDFFHLKEDMVEDVLAFYHKYPNLTNEQIFRHIIRESEYKYV